MDYEAQAMIEANELTPQQYADFGKELETIPSKRSPINGKTAVLCFDFMEDTGARVKEMIHIKRRDISFSTRIVIITHPKAEKQCKCSVWEYRDLRTRARRMVSAAPDCALCHGKGKWKKPQRTTFTPRLHDRLKEHCKGMADDDYLFPISRQSLWSWGKLAGQKAGINIFQQKDQKLIEGIFLHLFRALCSKRMVADAKADKYADALVACKMRHSSNRVVTDRYTKVDINYLITWESKRYGTEQKS